MSLAVVGQHTPHKHKAIREGQSGLESPCEPLFSQTTFQSFSLLFFSAAAQLCLFVVEGNILISYPDFYLHARFRLFFHLQVINTGIKVWCRNNSGEEFDCAFRLAQEVRGGRCGQRGAQTGSPSRHDSL